MKKHLLILATFLLTFAALKGQTQVAFQKTYGIGTGTCVQQTSDSGFVFIGYATGSISGISLIKTDFLGVRQWSHYYAIGNDELLGFSIQQTNDDGFIIAGNIIPNISSNENIILLKTSSNGTLQWKKYFDFDNTEYGFSVIQSNDGGFILTGRTYTDIFLLKTDSNGSLLWEKTYGGFYSQQGKCVRQTSDGGFIITGFNYTGSDYNVCLIKADSVGTLQWTRTYGGSNADFGRAVEQTTDGGYIITGSTQSYGAGATDVYLIKTATDGTLQWTKTFGGTLGEEGNSIQQTYDSGYIITGSTNSFGSGNSDVYLIKTDANGVFQWSKTFGGTGGEEGNSVKQTNDGGFVINGCTYSSFATYSPDIYLIKTDSNGNSGCYETSSTSIMGTGGIEGAGCTQDTIGCTTGNLTVGTNFGSLANTICSTVSINEFQKNEMISIYPNPFSSQTTIQIDEILKDVTMTIYNSLGLQVKQIKNINGKEIIFNRDNLLSGLYFFRITQYNKIYLTKKLVITD